MNHKPIVVFPEAEFLSENYGISSQRRDLLLIGLNRLGEGMYHKKSMPLHVMIDQIGDLTNNKEEFTWCITVQMAWLVKNGFMLL